MRLVRPNTFETNSSSTHALVIISKDDYKAWQENKKVLNLYSGETEPLSDEDKKIIRNEDGSIDYNGEHFEDEYDFMESDYCEVIGDSNASKEYIDNYADVEKKELGDKVIMSVYRGERW